MVEERSGDDACGVHAEQPVGGRADVVVVRHTRASEPLGAVAQPRLLGLQSRHALRISRWHDMQLGMQPPRAALRPGSVGIVDVTWVARELSS